MYVTSLSPRLQCNSKSTPSCTGGNSVSEIVLYFTTLSLSDKSAQHTKSIRNQNS